MYPDYAVVQVGIIVAGSVDRTFQFTYNRDVTVEGFEPPFGFYDQSHSIVVKATNLHPHADIKCKYTLGTAVVVDAHFLTNKTAS